MTTTIDLTPFGFTATESRVYNSLLDLGPSSGYAIARALGLARANTYHALSSLREKGAINVLAEGPLRVRAVRPDGLATLFGSRFNERLATLDEQVRRRGDSPSGETVVAITTERALIELATRMIVREKTALQTLAPARFYSATGLAWRKRHADTLPCECWVYGGNPAGLPVMTHEVPADYVSLHLHTHAVLMAADSSAIWVTWDHGTEGWWTQERLSVGLVRTSITNAATA